MADEEQSANSSEQVFPSRRKESIVSELLIPKDTLDQPCDVVLMVKDGKQFKAHRRVLSEDSHFFEKLLSSDMKETQEGVVRLEMFTESVMAATLQFIYTGDVQILTEDNAQDLIVVADFLLLEKLKLLAGGVLIQTLNTSNCISTFYFAARYQCKDLLSSTRKFILANFTSIYASNRDDVLNMSLRSREIEMWISSDEIDVSAEEDVFNIILAWIDHDRNRRKRYFVSLFRHVRLVYVSREFLRHDIATNELVQDNNSCLTLVKEAINLVDSQNCYSLSVPPRKSLETPVIVINLGENTLCYFPRDNSWCKLGEIPAEFITLNAKFVPCDGQLYSAVLDWWYYRPMPLKDIKYNPYSNKCVRLPSLEEPGRYLRKTFVRNGDEMCAFMSEPCVREHLLNWQQERFVAHINASETLKNQNCDSRKHVSFLTKYKPESNSWEDVTSFDRFDLRDCFCIVANDNFIYFIGGRERSADNECRFLSSVDRFDLSKNQWEKAADTPVARCLARGAALNTKIYIIDGFPLQRWEVYDETTNEWQIITGIRDGVGCKWHILGVDGDCYALCSEVICKDLFDSSENNFTHVRIERYNAEKNKWETKTGLTARFKRAKYLQPEIICWMRIFKGLSNIRQMVESVPSDSLPVATTTQPSFHTDPYITTSTQKRHRRCCIV